MDTNDNQPEDDSSRTKPPPPAKRRFYRLQRLLLIDVLRDPESRPFIAWAGAMLLFGVLIYRWFEGWSVIDALYFCVITLATVGFGDLTPTTPEARLFTVFYVINGIGILLALFDRIRVVRSGALFEARAAPRDDTTEP